MFKFRVTIVFDRKFDGALLRGASSNHHFWLVASVNNDKAVREYWKGAGSERRYRVTMFESSTTQRLELLAILELLGDHYGEFTEYPEVDEVRVIGLDVADFVRQDLAHWGLPVVRQLSIGALFSHEVVDD